MIRKTTPILLHLFLLHICHLLYYLLYCLFYILLFIHYLLKIILFITLLIGLNSKSIWIESKLPKRISTKISTQYLWRMNPKLWCTRGLKDIRTNHQTTIIQVQELGMEKEKERGCRWIFRIMEIKTQIMI